MNYAGQLPDLNWPPTIEELTGREQLPPPLLLKFLHELLLKDTKNPSKYSERSLRMVNSYAADMIYGVSKGKVVTAKHFLLALGLHNLTGTRKVIDINHRLGHCISYNEVCDVETALAQKAQALALTDTILELQPKRENEVVLTFFWVDNFDVLVDRQFGGGSVNTREENNLLKHAVLHKITDLNKRYLHGGRTTMLYLNLSGHDLI